MKKTNRLGYLQASPFEATPTQTAPFTLAPPKFMTVAAIREAGTLSRTHIAEAIGYSPSKITSVVNDLIQDGILEEKGEGPATGARRAREIGFNPQFGYIVAARIGFTKLDIALVDFTEHIRLRRMLPLPPTRRPGHGPQPDLPGDPGTHRQARHPGQRYSRLQYHRAEFGRYAVRHPV